MEMEEEGLRMLVYLQKNKYCNSMNQYYYDNILKYYLPLHQRPILTKNDYYIHAHKLSLHFERRIILANISLHTGVPCNRYCICNYFDTDAIVDYYDRIKGMSVSREPND